MRDCFWGRGFVADMARRLDTDDESRYLSILKLANGELSVNTVAQTRHVHGLLRIKPSVRVLAGWRSFPQRFLHQTCFQYLLCA